MAVTESVIRLRGLRVRADVRGLTEKDLVRRSGLSRWAVDRALRGRPVRRDVADRLVAAVSEPLPITARELGVEDAAWH